MRVITVKVKGLQLVSGVWRSRKVLPPDVAAILGKAELTKTTGVAGEKGDMVALAKARDVAIREDHRGEFKRMIEEARKADADPLAKLEREIGDLRRFKLEEIADFLAERGHPNPLITEPEPIEPVTFVTLQDAWELKNTNERTRRTKRRYMTRLAEHLGHNDANRVKPEDFAAFEGVLLTQANAGEIAHKSVENILAGIKAVFAAGVKAKKITTNPTAGISFQAKKSQLGKTLGYSVEQVGLILREGRNQPPEIRYPTLIAAFSGARVGEIADATTHDVYRVGDMWVLDIRTDYREKGQEIKNEPSIRIFPLHQQIIEEGFIDYWQ
jgi:integrase